MKKKIKFIIPVVITSVLLLIIFYFQGLYPFSNNSIVQVDADYQFIPVLYRIYDFLHGNGNIIYDDIGFGNNIYISMIIQGSIFSPLSLLLYLTPRDNIINFYNIIIIVKMCLLSLTTYIYINRTYKIKEFYKVVFAVLYAFSGWVILNYFNIMWLDSVILFPLIIMCLNELLNKGKYLGYIITLSLSLIISYYISYFILLFILFYSFIYILLKIDKDKVKSTIFKLGLSTFIAILISSFSLIPSLYQTLISSRFDSSGSNIIFYNFINKSLYLMFSSVFLFIFILLIFKYKKDRKNIYIYLILFILFSVGLLVEPINLALHMGSYWGFPYRYSFVTLFILMSGSLYYFEKYDNKGFKKHQWIRLLILIIIGIGIVYTNKLFYNDIKDGFVILDFKDIDVYMKIVIIFFMIVIMLLLSLTFKGKLRYISFSIVCILQVLIYSGWTMYYSDGYYLTKGSNDINNNMNIVKNDIKRYKMGYTYYTPDYGFIYNVNTLDNWLHILPSNEINVYKNLGYKNTDTCVRSYGGTIFSDWLFNVGYLIDTNSNKSSDMYKLLDQYDRYNLYKYNYNNEFGLVYSKDNEEIDYDNLYGFDLQNQMYQDLLNKDTNIVDISWHEYYNVNDLITLNYEINDKGFVYISFFDDINYIKVNNNRFMNYQGSNYIVDLGLFDDDIEIKIGIDSFNSFNFYMGFIKYDDIINLDSNIDNVVKLNNGYDIEVNNSLDNGYLFLPINNIYGLSAYVNNKKVNIDSYMDNFVSIKLDDGYNEVSVRYEMPLFKLGILLSVIGIICLLLFSKIPDNKFILNITYYVYIIFSLLLYVYIYGLSFFKYYNR